LADKFKRFEARLESRLGGGAYFDGERFSLVDAVFGPVFRYFDVFDRIGEFDILTGKPKTEAYRQSLSTRPSVRAAVSSGVSPGAEFRIVSYHGRHQRQQG